LAWNRGVYATLLARLLRRSDHVSFERVEPGAGVSSIRWQSFVHETISLRLGGSGPVAWSNGPSSVRFHLLERCGRGDPAGQHRRYWADATREWAGWPTWAGSGLGRRQVLLGRWPGCQTPPKGQPRRQRDRTPRHHGRLWHQQPYRSRYCEG